MVVIKDEGSHFDAPIDKVWAYVQDEAAHGGAHVSTRNGKNEMLNENTVLRTMEVNMGGNWVKTKNRVTLLPPLGVAIEVLEGPMAGSKFVNYYTPKGHTTEVSVVGDFSAPGMPAAQIEPAARMMLEMMYAEDAPAIKKFASGGHH